MTFLSLLLPFAEAWQNQAWTGHWHWLRLIPAIWFVLVTGALMGRTSARTARNIAAELLLVISLPMFFLTVSTPTVWYVPYDEEDDDVSRYLRLDETVLYEQPALLEAALNEVKPGKPGVPELFFLGVGGHQQNVFLRETRAVETLFAERFDTAGHSLLLVNHKDTAHTLPMANLTSLRQALARMGERMNEEDTLFLLLTSHGTPDHLLSFQLWPFDFTDLSPKTLRQALDDARIKRRVVVVSACYSGGFMPALRDENTLVITAAAADRTSFGCNDENEFTEFGRAYFDEALRETRSFTRAFDLAAKRIAERENAKGLTPSLPQMQGGEGLQLAED
ncbi:hypothetical protein FACS1894101_3540 [Betaproteobacteria bacterium]|nr:hypothetical protein FACS1894101_3540 [Betaproteobacteria bacterium]